MVLLVTRSHKTLFLYIGMPALYFIRNIAYYLAQETNISLSA